MYPGAGAAVGYTHSFSRLLYDGEARLLAVSLADVVPVGTRIVGDNDGLVGWIEVPDVGMGLEAHPPVRGCHGLP